MDAVERMRELSVTLKGAADELATLYGPLYYAAHAKATRDVAPSTLGERVRAAREARGFSLSDVASRSSLTKSYIVAVEQGRKTNLGLETVGKLAAALGADPSWIAYGVVTSGDEDAPKA